MTVVTVASVLDPSLYIPELKTCTREAALSDLVGLAHQAGTVRGPQLLLDLLAVRERLGSTAIGKGVALPHARSLTVVRAHLVVARTHRGVPWDAPDAMPVSLILLTLTPGDWSEEAHHSMLARAAAVARLQRNRQRLMDAGSFAEVAAVLREVGA
jgi:mannitol/fructose-specific phosphotransferase system IIA component (Ntr-type)